MSKSYDRRRASFQGETGRAKILQIGNYPPPACGWAIQTKLLVEEIRRRGHVCQVMNINENRKRKSDQYVDVQNGADYLRKLLRFARQGYRFQVHVNGQSRTGYLLALLAVVVGRLWQRPAALSWRGGLNQKYFPRPAELWVGGAYRLLFRLAGQIVCNDLRIKQAIESYGIPGRRVTAIPAFSRQNLDFRPQPLPWSAEAFLESHGPVFFCYVSFRPEYRLPVLREAMRRVCRRYPRAGFIWLGFPSREMPQAQEMVAGWAPEERASLLLLGNLPHGVFLMLLARCSAYIRTPVCDGVASSVLESLALGIPVLASQNGSRPASVVTYRENDAADLADKLKFVMTHYGSVKKQTCLAEGEDNIARTADWLLGERPRAAQELDRGLAYAD
ncbi:MAG TPA: glycosyltransferase [Terriglobales bacterium]|jgi:glycosyltransferase involved in cell wall biosynthesis|nr:glycosyltransferase [Terriglobales bacterium]